MASLQDLAADLEHAVTWRNVASENLRKCNADVAVAAGRLTDAMFRLVHVEAPVEGPCATTATRAPTTDAPARAARPFEGLAQDRLAKAVETIRARESATTATPETTMRPGGEAFRCSHCKEWSPLADVFISNDGKPFCPPCWGERMSDPRDPPHDEAPACGVVGCRCEEVLAAREHGGTISNDSTSAPATTATCALSADELQQLRAAEAQDNAADAITDEGLDQWQPEDDEPGGSCHECGEDTCVCLVEGQPGPGAAADAQTATESIPPMVAVPTSDFSYGSPPPQRPAAWHERAVDQVIGQTAAATARHQPALPDAEPDPGATIKSMLLWAVRHAQKSAGPKAVPAALLVELVVKHKPSLNRMSVRVELPKLAKAGLLSRPGIGFYALPGYAPPRDRREEPDTPGQNYSKTA
jgi:hypothetical protein